jgi:hypothetical protein
VSDRDDTLKVGLDFPGVNKSQECVIDLKPAGPTGNVGRQSLAFGEQVKYDQSLWSTFQPCRSKFLVHNRMKRYGDAVAPRVEGVPDRLRRQVSRLTINIAMSAARTTMLAIVYCRLLVWLKSMVRSTALLDGIDTATTEGRREVLTATQPDATG